MRRGYTGCFWNVHLKGAECKTLHDWAGLQGLHIGNQTPFQAFPSSLSRAVDIQGSSEAPLSNPHGRTANSFTLCHSRMQHTEPTPEQRLRLGQKSRRDFEPAKGQNFNEMNWLVHLCSLLSWGFSVSLQLTLISFSSAARKNTACSGKKWKFIYITRPLKDFKTQLPAKWNQAQWLRLRLAYWELQRMKEILHLKQPQSLSLTIKSNIFVCAFVVLTKAMDVLTDL